MTIYTAQRKLGDLIVALRKKCKLGVKALAKQSRVAKKIILQMECGIGPFVKEKIDRVLGVLAVTDETILDSIQACLKVMGLIPRGPALRTPALA